MADPATVAPETPAPLAVPAAPPTEPETPEETAQLSDKKRRAFWTDAAASLDRRISALESSATKSAWTWQVIVALILGALALPFALGAIIVYFRRHE